MKKIVLILICMFFIGLVSGATDIQINEQAELGVDITYPEYSVVSLGDPFELIIHAYNKSNGLLLTDSTTNCTLHIYKGNGTEELDDDFTYVGHSYNLNISASVLDGTGIHSYVIHCNNSGAGGFVSGLFQVTLTGEVLSEEMSILYIGLLGILVFLFVVCIGTITLLPSKDNYDDEGVLLSINQLKYLRPIFYAISYLLFMALMFISSNIAKAYLNTDLIGEFFFVIYSIMMIFMLPMVFIWFAYIIYSIFQDKQMKKYLDRGIIQEHSI